MERLEQTGRVYSINGQNIRARKKTNNKWYETQDSISYWDDFSKQKIVYREISEEMDACIINEEVYVNNKCYIITGEHLEYLICVLNSKLFNRIILQSANQTGGKGRDFLEKIHVPYRDNDILADLYRDLLLDIFYVVAKALVHLALTEKSVISKIRRAHKYNAFLISKTRIFIFICNYIKLAVILSCR